MIRDLRREEAMDRLYERMEQTVKRRVLKAAKNYRVVSFSNVCIRFPDYSVSPLGSILGLILMSLKPTGKCS
jgi:hypothetical protein